MIDTIVIISSMLGSCYVTPSYVACMFPPNNDSTYHFYLYLENKRLSANAQSLTLDAKDVELATPTNSKNDPSTPIASLADVYKIKPIRGRKGNTHQALTVLDEQHLLTLKHHNSIFPDSSYSKIINKWNIPPYFIFKNELIVKSQLYGEIDARTEDWVTLFSTETVRYIKHKPLWLKQLLEHSLNIE